MLDYKINPNDVKNWREVFTVYPFVGVHKQPGMLWNGMMATYAPMSVRGFIWYQGCSNSKEPQRYCSKMHALYNGLCKEFENPDLSFYYAQLAPHRDWSVGIQLAQAQFEREQKNAAMAVLVDVGNVYDIHPNDKRTVAMRLALHALRRDYGFDLQDNSPTVKEHAVEGDRVVLTFNDAESFYVYNVKQSGAEGFEIAGADGKFRPAEIRNYLFVPDKNARNGGNIRYIVEGNRLEISAEGVTEPKAIRYLHRHPWTGSLYNESGLPLGPFKINSL